MANLPNDPVSTVPPAAGTNPDLPGADFPSLSRITTNDLVGPDAANRQHAAMEKRALTLRDRVNKLIEAMNVLDTTFLRRDGAAPKDGNAGLRADIAANNHTLTGLRAALTNGEPVRFEEFMALAAIVSSIPITTIQPGMIGAFPVATAPAGWIAANGTLFTTANYVTAEGVTTSYSGGLSWGALDALRAFLSSTWGGDGVTSFRVPDYRGRVILGSGLGVIPTTLTNRAVGSYGGEESHVLTTPELPSHHHEILGDDDTSGSGYIGGVGDGDQHTHKGNTENTGGNDPHNNMQPYGTALICLKL